MESQSNYDTIMTTFTSRCLCFISVLFIQLLPKLSHQRNVVICLFKAYVWIFFSCFIIAVMSDKEEIAFKWFFKSKTIFTKRFFYMLPKPRFTFDGSTFKLNYNRAPLLTCGHVVLTLKLLSRLLTKCALKMRCTTR